MRFSKCIILIIVAVSFASCNKNFKYLQAELPHSDTLFPNNIPVYHIQTNDLLYIEFTSMLKESVEFFNKNQSSVNSAAGSNNTDPYEWSGYRVNDSGYIDMPIMGEILVEGYTLMEVKGIINKKAKEYIEDVHADVKLLSFTIDMMGEFNSPGPITTTRNNLNIMEAIDLAGGISYNGNWKKVYIIRHGIEGKETFYIDITDRELLGTEEYYLLPHDVVYVEPRSMRLTRINVADFTFLLTTLASTVTTIVLLTTINR
jgi:polysaccharide export outer membrane protein